MTIAMGADWSRSVAIGFKGRAPFTLTPTPAFPVTRTEVLIGGIVSGSMDGADLRGGLGLEFAVPRVPGPYALVVHAYAQGGRLCGTTTAQRIVSVN